jgi:UrcA family protein
MGGFNMKLSCLRSATAAVALGLMVGHVFAQSTAEVRVQATRVVSTKPGGRSSSGLPVVDLSLTYGVSLSDLNLGTNTGANAAAARIKAAALAACKELSRQYPDSAPSDEACAKTATDKGMVQLHELVAAAESKGVIG